jgi:ferrochelatase
MARRSAYESQLREAIRLVADRSGIGNWEAVFQSRSGSPHTPWLEPDVLDVIRKRSTENWTRIAIVPIGFISDHMEVLFDLDTEASDLCAELGVELIRVPTVGTHPKFIAGIRELILERMTADPERKALGTRGPNHDVCPHECCLSGTGDSRPAA